MLRVVVLALVLATGVARAEDSHADSTSAARAESSHADSTSAARAESSHARGTAAAHDDSHGRGTAAAHADDSHADSTSPHTQGPPAMRYAALSRDDCEGELTRRHIDFERETARGVLAPVRLKGPLHGVVFRTNLKDDQRETTPWEIADCRLVLALDDFATILAKHDIVEVRHYSMYRVPPKSWADDKIGSRHNGGLALDAARFIRKDGGKLDVLEDFKGRIGAKTCGKKARKAKTAEAKELREIVCEAVDDQLFNVVLTPDFNRHHRNHFHLEVTAGVKWFWVR